MDSGVITYSISYILGIYIFWLLDFQSSDTLAILVFLISFALLISLGKLKKHYIFFTVASHLIFFVLGLNGFNLSGRKETQTPGNGERWEITEKVAEGFKRFTPYNDEHSILCALSLGIKDNISKEIKKSYSNAGVMHILALSGMHIGIIFLIINSLLFPLNLNYKTKRIKSIIALAVICLYALATGASPSITRATIMICIYSISSICNRKGNKWNNIALSALIMGIFNPWDVTQIGFQLSFAAIIGIAAIYPTIEGSISTILEKANWNRTVKTIAKQTMAIIGISVSCQITTLPLSLYYFGNNAQYFILANLAAIPLTTIILYLLVMAIATSWIEPVGDFICLTLNYSIKTMNLLIDFISN